MSNEEIVEQIQRGIDVTLNQERLWEKNRPYIIKCIKKYIGNCHEQDMNDFINEGFIGLVTAANRYKAEQGVKFLTYATFYIRAAMYRYNGMNTYTVRIPEYLKERMRKLAVFKHEYREEFQREPEPEEIQKALHISAKSLSHLEKVLLNMSTKSLDEYISDDGDTKLIDMLSTDERIDEL
ncbi:MAG: sigma-70 family RNA polymerase sigma factor, partial [Lachnospiraceae bacterium]|nr:sigma-70 family RNA polymerase sigma factor [Lachnospiraceae bacterium]